MWKQWSAVNTFQMYCMVMLYFVYYAHFDYSFYRHMFGIIEKTRPVLQSHFSFQKLDFCWEAFHRYITSSPDIMMNMMERSSQKFSWLYKLVFSRSLFLSLSLWQSFQGELIYDPVFLCLNDRQTQWEIIIWGKYCWIAVGGQGSQKVILQPQTEKTSGESHTNLTASSLVFFFFPHLPAGLDKEPFGSSVCKPSSIPRPPADDFALISQ